MSPSLERVQRAHRGGPSGPLEDSAVSPGSRESAGTSDLESAWITRVRSGDLHATEAIFRAYYQRLCAFAERFVGSSDQAEDLVEDVFVRAWEGRRSCVGCESLQSYLYVAVRNRAYKFLRHQKVVVRGAERFSRGGTIPGMSAPVGTPEENAVASELAAAAQRAIDGLPERSRQAYLLHRQHGMSYAAIADAMGIAPKTVENHLSRAVQALRESLAPWSR